MTALCRQLVAREAVAQGGVAIMFTSLFAGVVCAAWVQANSACMHVYWSGSKWEELQAICMPRFAPGAR